MYQPAGGCSRIKIGNRIIIAADVEMPPTQVVSRAIVDAIVDEVKDNLPIDDRAVRAMSSQRMARTNHWALSHAACLAAGQDKASDAQAEGQARDAEQAPCKQTIDRWLKPIVQKPPLVSALRIAQIATGQRRPESAGPPPE
jgi:hypothetical protein